MTVAVCLGIGLTIGRSTTAHAYPPPTGSQLTVVGGCTSATVGSSCSVTITVTGPGGAPTPNDPVTVTLTGVGSLTSGNQTGTTVTGTTNSSGVLSLLYNATQCGTAVITATDANGLTGTTTITVPCTPNTGGILPATSALPPGPPLAVALTAGGLGGLVLLGGVVLLAAPRLRSARGTR